MIDLTKITTPFGLLDEETQTALMAHGGPYECFEGNSWENINPGWVARFTYRVKPAPVTKPSIDWSHVAEEFDWLATDEDGRSFITNAKPTQGRVYWAADAFSLSVNASFFASFKPGTCNWRDSLVRRPGK